MQKEQEKNVNDTIELQRSFKTKGPHQADLSITVALNQCKTIEEQIEQIENDEKRLKSIYRLFNLDMHFSKELQSLKKVSLVKNFMDMKI